VQFAADTPLQRLTAGCVAGFLHYLCAGLVARSEKKELQLRLGC